MTVGEYQTLLQLAARNVGEAGARLDRPKAAAVLAAVWDAMPVAELEALGGGVLEGVRSDLGALLGWVGALSTEPTPPPPAAPGDPEQVRAMERIAAALEGLVAKPVAPEDPARARTFDRVAAALEGILEQAQRPPPAVEVTRGEGGAITGLRPKVAK